MADGRIAHNLVTKTVQMAFQCGKLIAGSSSVVETSKHCSIVQCGKAQWVWTLSGDGSKQWLYRAKGAGMKMWLRNGGLGPSHRAQCQLISLLSYNGRRAGGYSSANWWRPWGQTVACSSSSYKRDHSSARYFTHSFLCLVPALCGARTFIPSDWTMLHVQL